MPPTLTLDLRRPDDQLWLRFELLDLAVAGDQLEQSGPAPAIRVVFGSQHTAEDAVTTDPPPPAPLGHRSAGPSRVVFAVQPPIALRLDTLLDFARFSLAVQAETGPPPDDVTALELPQSLLLTPTDASRFTAAAAPITHDGITELWTARLDGGGAGAAELLALHNLSSGDGVAQPLPTSAHRAEIVTATDTLGPALAHRLWLSGHGAFADLLGEWPSGQVERWIQRLAAGRDLAVEVATRGFLLPFGHAASMVTVNRRVFLPDESSQVVAVLVQETFLAVTEATKTFPAPLAPHGGRRFPFTEVTVAETSWLPVAKAEIDDVAEDEAWNLVEAGSGRDLVLSYTAVDRAGNEKVAFALPAAFVAHDHAFAVATETTPDRLADYYSLDDTVARREVDLGGSQVAFADEVTSGATTKITELLRFTLDDPSPVRGDALRKVGQPAIFPAVEEATVIDDALATSQGSVGEAVRVRPHHRWEEYGLEAGNFDQAYLSLLDTARYPVGGAGRAVLSVDLSVDQFDQVTGAGLDLASETSIWDPAQALDEASDLLGIIPLGAIIPAIAFDQATPGVDLPAVDVQVTADELISTLRFTPQLQDAPPYGFFTRPPNDGATLWIENRMSLDGATEPATTVEVSLRRVRLVAPPGGLSVVQLDFDEIRIVEPPDGPAEVDFDLAEWEFGDLLSWLRPLADLFSGLGNGPRVDLSSAGIEIDVDIPVPDVRMGVVSARNIDIGLDAELPLDGRRVVVAASVGRESRPVEVSVLTFEGSFYLEVEVSPDGGLLALAVSAEVSMKLFGLDIIIAEATVTLAVAGYFALDSSGVTFAGCVEVEGVIGLLGLVEVAVGVAGSLVYRSAQETMVLSGSITWSADTFLGGDSGAIPIGRTELPLSDGPLAPRAAAREGDLSFGDRYRPTDWELYTGAFA